MGTESRNHIHRAGVCKSEGSVFHKAFDGDDVVGKATATNGCDQPVNACHQATPYSRLQNGCCARPQKSSPQNQAITMAHLPNPHTADSETPLSVCLPLSAVLPPPLGDFCLRTICAWVEVNPLRLCLCSSRPSRIW